MNTIKRTLFFKTKIFRILFALAVSSMFVSCNNCNSQQNKPSYFDCDYYNYFQDTAYPKQLSKQDTMNLIKYAIRYGTIRQALLTWGKDTDITGILYLLPVIQNKIDTGWFSFLNSENRNKFSFRSLDYSNIYTAIAEDAVIKGKVIDKRQPKDTTVCLIYKTEYAIEVTDVIHSYFPLKNGDVVLTKDVMGFSCGQKSMYYEDYSHRTDHKVGDESIFLLSKFGDYQITFLWKASKKFDFNKYDDEYCPQSFAIPNSNDTYRDRIKNKIDDLKLFFKTKFLTHEYY